MPLYAPKYVKPGQREAERARLRTWLIWIAIAIPVAFFFFAYGYSDQAPAALRNAIIAVDRSMGYPIVWLLSRVLG